MVIAASPIAATAIAAQFLSIPADPAPVVSEAVSTGDPFYTDAEAERIIVADIAVYDSVAGGEVMEYVANTPYVTAGIDTPAHRRYAGVIADAEALTFRRELAVGDIIGGQTLPDRGGLSILTSDDPDGLVPNYDHWFDTDRYAFDGRTVTVYGKLASEPFKDRRTLLTGATDGLDTDTQSITLRLRGFFENLVKPIQSITYAGTGNAEGGDEIAGKPKPLAFGRLFNVPPVLINAGLLVYQLHDGVIEEIEEVRDKGAAMTAGVDHADYEALAAATVTNDYDTCLAEGMIRLASPPAGTVTVDAKGSTLGGTWSASAAKILSYLVKEFGGFSSIDSTSIDTLHTANSAEIGYFCPAEEVLLPDVMDAVAATVGAWFGFSRTGSFEVGRLESPPESSSQAITENDMLENSLQREETGRVSWRVRVNYKPNWEVQSEFAGSVVEADRQEYSQQWRAATAENSTTQTRHKLAIDRSFDSYFYHQADADAEASRRLTLLGSQRVFWRMQLLRFAGQLSLGQAVTLSHPRFGLAAGKVMRVVGLEENLLGRPSGLTLWG